MAVPALTRTEASESVEATRTLRPLVVAGFFALVFALAIRPALDGDLWWHLRTAQWMVQHHDWVGVDPFTHTRPGVARVQTDWLAQLLFYGTWRAGGLMAISGLIAAVATAGTYVVYRATSGPLGLRLAITALAAAASSVHWVARPQMFSFFLTAFVYLLVRRWRHDGGRWIWWLVPIVLVWTNTHGGVVYGVLVLLAVLGGEWVNALVGPRLSSRFVAPAVLPRARLLQLSGVVAASVAAMAVNPSGFRVYGLPFHQVASSGRYVGEVQPPALGDVWVWPFFALLALAGFVLIRTWRRFDAVDLVPLAVATVMALRFTRSIPFFAIVAAPIVCARLVTWWNESGRAPLTTPTLSASERSKVRVAAWVVIAVVAVTAPIRVAPGRVDDARRSTFPVAAVDWLNAERPPGELFNTFNWGGFLMLEAPDYRVSVDPRTDVYDDYLDVYVDTVSARPGWQEELDREGISTAVLNTYVPLTDALRSEPGWEVAYEDDQAVIFVRSDAWSPP